MLHPFVNLATGINERGCAKNGEGIRRVQEAMAIAADKQQHLRDSGIPIQLNLFGEEDPTDSLYSNFITDHARQQSAQINSILNTRKLAEKLAKSPNFQELSKGTGILLDRAAYNRLKNKKDIQAALQEELHRWQHPWTNISTLADEINTAFAKKHPDAWAEMQRRRAELTQPDTQTEEPTPSTVTGDTPTQSLFDASVFSPSEASGLKALRNITTTGKDARFHSDTLNQDVLLPRGSAGHLKDPSNPNSKVIGANGLIHILTMRMAHGETMEEAAYTAAKAIMAAVNGEKRNDPQNKDIIYLHLDQYKAVVRLQWDGNEKVWPLRHNI